MKAEEIETKAIKKTALIILESNSFEETIDWIISKMEVKYESQLKESKEAYDHMKESMQMEIDDLKAHYGINNLKN